MYAALEREENNTKAKKINAKKNVFLNKGLIIVLPFHF
jgi:hypothetical protein